MMICLVEGEKMIRVFNCTEEKDRSGRPKKMYVVTGVKTRKAALNEVAKYKKKSLKNKKMYMVVWQMKPNRG